MLITRSRETSQASRAPSAVENLRPLAIDLAVPLGAYFLLRYGLDASVVIAYTVSGIVPAARTITSAARDRRVNGLAALMLAVNIAGIALSLVTGDVRLMVAKDSGISSVIAFGILASVWRGRPLMTAGLKPWITKGEAVRTAAWDRLAANSATFRRYEIRFSLIWGAALLAECVARLVGAFTLPVATMSWLSTVFTVAGIGVAMLASGAVAAGPMEELVNSEPAG